MEKKTKGLEHVILDPPGQAEVTASGAILTEALAASFPSVAVGVPDASGRTNPVAFMSNVLCCVPAGEDFLAPSFPSVAVGVPDASGRTNPVAFMSNVLCCVPAGEDFLPLWVSPSAWQEQSGLPGRYSPGQRQEPSYLRPRLPLSLRSPWVCRTPLAGLTLWLLCPTCCAACLQNCHERKYFRGASLQISPEYARRFQPGGKELWKKSSLKVASGDHQVFQPRRTRREMGESGSNS
ncbi:uncharacterized protein LOC127471020 isoform X23 [Manacus candei]|uniref:uncharacterized protein LOC127471020 isoform X23 n=1 Tax=Manacus candei TaxID=415023 RepID=UPI0022265C3E|nr:uncharacterized protein LOC127471020 isoform X23 [Manacus candei]XP_051645455.1 uncharacterized protein LOC127471020 isoform X25 [Manacus candei]XP_051645517.1 uncharacterized protein LOC127471020 isoform X26 [Manacus candei]XP_051645600.1 uncharacterized protein LOC127471020 isoform X23 [Manacus candei]